MAIRDQVARHSDYNVTRDYIPTPPFATRALYEYVAPELWANSKEWVAYDPAAGQGHMTRVFKEYGHPKVIATDIEPTEGGILKRDFLDTTDYRPDTADVIITNPPYKYFNEFVDRSLSEARVGVAMLCRVQSLEGQRRYASLYSNRPPTQIAFFSDRIPFKVGKVVRRAPKMFFHVWVWWNKTDMTPRPPIWIPPNAQAKLEKDSDYE